MSQIIVRRSVSRIGLLQIAIIILTLITAFVHLQKGIGIPSFSSPPGAGRGGGPSILSLLPIPLPTLFILNFVAYLVLIVALYLPILRPYQRIIRWLLIVLAALTIIAYLLISGTRLNLLGYLDKLIEVGLIVLLLIEDWRVTHTRVASIRVKDVYKGTSPIQAIPLVWEMCPCRHP